MEKGNIVVPTSKQVNHCRENKPWSMGNQVLYDLCSNNLKHRSTEEILAKTLLIGRTYAAAIERRKNKKSNNDNFYINTVVPTFKSSRLDSILQKLKHRQLSLDSLKDVISAHSYLTGLLSKITELNKRSFSSKYLHFHLPNLFFIYDSRAVYAMREYVPKTPKHFYDLIHTDTGDKKYSDFLCKCFYLQQIIYEKHKLLLSPRQLDHLLIDTSNKEIINTRDALD